MLYQVERRVSEIKIIREYILVVQVSRVDLIDFQFGCLFDYLFDYLFDLLPMKYSLVQTLQKRALFALLLKQSSLWKLLVSLPLLISCSYFSCVVCTVSITYKEISISSI